jgi:hypothetical protein
MEIDVVMFLLASLTSPLARSLFSPFLPVVFVLRLLNHDVQHDPEASLNTMIECQAVKHKQQISIIAVKAKEEATLQRMLNKARVFFFFLSLFTSSRLTFRVRFPICGIQRIQRN